MAKLTKKQIQEIESVVYHLERALPFLGRDNIAVCRKSSAATTTEHYFRGDGSALLPIDKEIGSDLTGLQEGIKRIRSFVSTNS